jgi:ParB family chromosome partitioning protein
MSEKKRGLGRGLGALIPTAPSKDDVRHAPSPVDVLIPDRSAADRSANDRSANDRSADDRSADSEPAGGTSDGGPAPVAGAHFAELAISAITANPRQPREVFDEEAMAELVHSVREVGLLQPIVVRPAGPDRYELIMGERRWRAAGAAGLTTIPAIVRATGDDVMLRDALLENLHRAQLNPLEEAAAYDQLLTDFGCTHEELAGRIGRSRPQISNTLRLLRLPPSVQRRIAAGVLSAGHARAVLGLDDPAAQEQLAQRIVAEGLSVRSVEEIVAVGGEAARPRPRRVNKPVAPKLEVLAHRLSERFETRVKVDIGRSKGRIVVEFGSIDDLERIVALMSPAEPAPSSSPAEPAPSTPPAEPAPSSPPAEPPLA